MMPYIRRSRLPILEIVVGLALALAAIGGMLWMLGH
jgi:hypothetical protein